MTIIDLNHKRLLRRIEQEAKRNGRRKREHEQQLLTTPVRVAHGAPHPRGHGDDGVLAIAFVAMPTL